MRSKRHDALLRTPTLGSYLRARWRVLTALIILTVPVAVVTSTLARQTRRHSSMRARVDLFLHRSGTLEVTQWLTINSGGRHQSDSIDLPAPVAVPVRDLSLLSDAAANTSVRVLRPTPSSLRLSWRFRRPSSGQQIFRLHYLLLHAVQSASFPLTIWGSNRPLDRLDMTVSVSGRHIVPGVADARPEPSSGQAQVYVAPRNGQLRLAALHLHPHRAIRLHVRIPPAWLAAQRNATGPADQPVRTPAASAPAPAWWFHADPPASSRQHSWPAFAFVVLGLSFGAFAILVSRRTGRRRASKPAPRCHEPPNDISPVLAMLLLGHNPSKTDVAWPVLLDLVQRGHYLVSDGLEIIGPVKQASDLLGFEQRVAAHIDQGLAGRPMPLERVHAYAQDDAPGLEAEVVEDASKLMVEEGWIARTGLVGRNLLLLAAAVAVPAGWLGSLTAHQPDVLAAAWVAWGAIWALCLPPKRFLRAHTEEGQALAARWRAFLRYLRDLPQHLDDAPASLMLWERLLVYGVAFGMADEVLAAARSRLPAHMSAKSPVYRFYLDPRPA